VNNAGYGSSGRSKGRAPSVELQFATNVFGVIALIVT
jgi:hypothetical protein